jgi:hypothetical protein
MDQITESVKKFIICKECIPLCIYNEHIQFIPSAQQYFNLFVRSIYTNENVSIKPCIDCARVPRAIDSRLYSSVMVCGKLASPEDDLFDVETYSA